MSLLNSCIGHSEGVSVLPHSSILHASNNARTGAWQGSHGDCFSTFCKIEFENGRSCWKIPDLTETKILKNIGIHLFVSLGEVLGIVDGKNDVLGNVSLFRNYKVNIISKRTNMNRSITGDRLPHYINNTDGKHWLSMVVSCPRARWLASSVTMVTE